MSFINYSAREINCKLVYYGPGLCGKTTNLQFIYNKTREGAKGKQVGVMTLDEFSDYLAEAARIPSGDAATSI